MGEEEKGFRCPTCGMTSFNPNDLEQAFCGNCHEFTRRPEGKGLSRAPEIFLNLSDHSREILHKASQEERAVLFHIFNESRKAYIEMRCRNAHSAVRGQLLMQEIQDMIDEERRSNPFARGITCKPSCSFCCYQAVDVLRDEAAYIVSRLSLIPLWRKKETKGDPCHLLRGGECLIYDFRPSACRKLFSLDNPRRCDTIAKPGGGLKKWVSIYGEMFWSAVATENGTVLLSDLVHGRGGA